ncbi:MAG: transposase [Gemmatimonadales bacterium]
MVRSGGSGASLGTPRALRPGSVRQHRMSNHHAYQLYAHITWHTWRRVGCLNRAAAADVASAVASACRTSGVKVLRSAVLADHMLVSFRPGSRLSDFVRLAKSVAAVRASRRVPGAVRWARGVLRRLAAPARSGAGGELHCSAIRAPP